MKSADNRREEAAKRAKQLAKERNTPKGTADKVDAKEKGVQNTRRD